MIKKQYLANMILALVFIMPAGVMASGGHDDHDHGEPGNQKVIEQVIGNDKDGSLMAYVPGGIFIMGNENGDSDERPAHRVKLKPFYMDQFEITNIQYRKFISETKHQEPLFWNDKHFNSDLQPVVGVSWDDARAYAEWAGKRLPTEAEWEMAARSTDGREYPWGNFWYDKRCNSVEAGYNKVIQVGSFSKGASPYGIYDMAGNVWEWCLDTYSVGYYKNSAEDNPAGPKAGDDKVLRGGSWGYDKVNSRSSNRFWDDKGTRNRHFGFRCVKDVD